MTAEAFEALMGRSRRRVFNLAYKLSGNRWDAEDLTQEAFLRAYRSIGSYHGDRPFENWILRIVSRLFLDLVRYRKRRVTTISLDGWPTDTGESPLQELPDKTPTPDRIAADAQFDERLETALATLSPEHRLLITLADVEQMDYKEIAEMLGSPVGTIRSRLHRAHKYLRRALHELQQPKPKRV
jgi:RNA polymerase sigma-70 factor (ECF subfamily)